MFTIAKQFAFCASHKLGGLPEGHPCSRDHGHNYVAEIMLAAEELDETGFVADFSRLAPVRRYIDDYLDHRCLNDIVAQPSSELIARHLYDWCAANLGRALADRLHGVRVWETPTSCATFTQPLSAWEGR